MITTGSPNQNIINAVVMSQTLQRSTQSIRSGIEPKNELGTTIPQPNIDPTIRSAVLTVSNLISPCPWPVAIAPLVKSSADRFQPRSLFSLEEWASDVRNSLNLPHPGHSLQEFEYELLKSIAFFRRLLGE